MTRLSLQAKRLLFLMVAARRRRAQAALAAPAEKRAELPQAQPRLVPAALQAQAQSR